MNRYLFFIITFATTQLLGSSFILEIQYQEAENLKKVHKSREMFIGQNDSRMDKTLFVLKLNSLIKTSLINYHQNREKGREHSVNLHNSLSDLVSKAASTGSDIDEAILTVRKLADNMAETHYIPLYDCSVCESVAYMKLAPLASGLNITAGGVQDYAHFKKQVLDGQVPQVDAFIEEGFISSFNLTLPNEDCTDLICLNPAYTQDAGKLYIQVGMNSAVTAQTFKRPPVNLAFVLDISGSMSAMDNTERTRLEWAKEAIVQSIAKMNEEDLISLVLFDNTSRVLLKPIHVTDKEKILSLLRSIQPGGSTNLDAGLRDGYLLASQAYREGYQNRVILLSDAGLNTGITDQTTILKLVSDHAADEIGLTAIGIGENFHHDFIHKITMSKGGNAIFVHTGQDMMKFFHNFDFLVTPIAYNLKISAELVGLDAKLVKAHGVPMLKDEPLKELINVRSLFFSEGSGGAIVLEYDLAPR